jgi:hypothetical protein
MIQVVIARKPLRRWIDVSGLILAVPLSYFAANSKIVNSDSLREFPRFKDSSFLAISSYAISNMTDIKNRSAVRA